MAARTLLRLLSSALPTAKADRIITCRVDAGKPFASTRGRNFQVRIAAWQEEDGTRHADPIVLKRDVFLPPSVSLWAQAMPAKSLCRVAIGPIEKRPYFYPTAPLLAFLGRGEDAGFAEASAPLVSPFTFGDPQVGTFQSRTGFPRDFQGEMDWHGTTINVSIQRGADFSEATLQRQATQLCDMRSRAAEILGRARLKAAEELYPVWHDNGWYGDGRVLDLDDWKARLSLCAIDLDPEGSFDLVFEDGDLFAGHAIVLHADESGQFENASLFG
ncbi:DUF2262 domain-containing protein [Aurantiacibacter sp. MUD61]|uniref:DUF2262 domain-containing protein n=1 Tax=Aurantiacibacter sp. MUD61 TaxID=3009083 RepID=UPI0022F0D119|nr:DUF2262 domain-containing protein [Aurantiacibacter sp. MUD61]